MTRIVIVNKSFEIGGIQSSMITLANELAKQSSVDIFAYDPHGPLRERVSDEVGILESGSYFRCLAMPIREVLRSHQPRMILFRAFSTGWTKLFGNRLPYAIAIRNWRKENRNGHPYDMAISFHQEQRKRAVVSGFTRVAERCFDAKVKIAWVHFDSDMIDLDSRYNLPFYERMNRIVCVSQSLMEAFSCRYPTLRDKMDFCYNLIDYDTILQRSTECINVTFPQGAVVCFSACRLTPEKAIVRAINVLSPYFTASPELFWYIAGEGPERSSIEAAIASHHLENQVILMGNQKNPYPYMVHASVVMNVSYHEAAPMVYLEAKALQIPIFATLTSSTKEFLGGYDRAILCENSGEGIYRAFANVIAAQGWLNRIPLPVQQERYNSMKEQLVRKIIGWQSTKG